MPTLYHWSAVKDNSEHWSIGGPASKESLQRTVNPEILSKCLTLPAVKTSNTSQAWERRSLEEALGSLVRCMPTMPMD
ncbi:MAG: hypothetical protein R3F19_23385 [Verrucomicrobiales bacterium]